MLTYLDRLSASGIFKFIKLRNFGGVLPGMIGNFTRYCKNDFISIQQIQSPTEFEIHYKKQFLVSIYLFLNIGK